jgi:hypothetical protein
MSRQTRIVIAIVIDPEGARSLTGILPLGEPMLRIAQPSDSALKYRTQRGISVPLRPLTLNQRTFCPGAWSLILRAHIAHGRARLAEDTDWHGVATLHAMVANLTASPVFD